MQAVLVIWHDAHSGSESWINIKDLDNDPAVVETIGFILPTAEGGKPGHITIFQSRNEDFLDHVLHIPQRMVQRIVAIPTISD